MGGDTRGSPGWLLRESALESYAPRPAASPRAPPYSACLLPASPRPQQRSSDAPPSVPVAPQHRLQLHFPEIPAALDRASGAGTGESRSLRRPGQGLSGRFGPHPPPPAPLPCDPRIFAASDPSRAGANLWLSRLEERKGRRVTSEPHSRRFEMGGALGGAFLPPLASCHTFGSPRELGRSGVRAGSGIHPPAAGHSGRAAL